MSIYKDPANGAPQIVWDLHNAVTMLEKAALLISAGHDKEAADALSLAMHSTDEAISKVKDAGYMAAAFSAERLARDEAELMAVMEAAA